MKRRRFVTALGGAALLPLVGHAQQPGRVRRVGALIGFFEKDPFAQRIVSAFVQALARFGWADGKNIHLDYRFAAGDPTLYETYAAELVALSPDAILAIPGLAAVALREKTLAIPIVFALMPDPVGAGLVQCLARPGGNVTGFSSYDPPIMGKWLQLLREVSPDVTRVLVIFNPDTAFTSTAFASLAKRAIEAAAPSFGMTVTFAPVHDDAQIENATTAQAREPGGGLIVLPDSFTLTHRDVIITEATHYGLPLISFSEFARAGGLMSYWFDPVDQCAHAASYIDRILRGASPADLPVQQPMKYSLIINLKTAKALGLTIPERMLEIADEVIE